MNRIAIAAVAIAVMVGIAIATFTQSRSRTATQVAAPTSTSLAATVLPENDPTPRPNVAFVNGGLVLAARVVPATTYDLRFGQNGTVTEILVSEGDQVAAGDIIAKLDGRLLELDVKTAEADVALARAAYEKLLDGSTPAEIAQAEARVARSEAQLEVTKVTITADDIAATQAQIAAYETKVAALEAIPTKEQIAASLANVQEAELNLASNRDTLSAEKSTFEARLELAANQLRDAQDTYRRNKEEFDRIAKPTAAEIDALARDERAMKNAELGLKVARIELEEAKLTEKLAIQAAEARVEAAKARHAQLLASKPIDEIADTKARIAQAQALLVKQRDAYRQAQIAYSESEVALSQADLNRVKQSPRAADLAEAEARIQQAELLLQKRRLAQETLVLRAPAAGVIAQLRIQSGQLVSSDSPAGTIADVSSWQILTADLPETAVVSLSEGDPVLVTFYALPDLELEGTITQIQTIGQITRNLDATYTIVVTPKTNDPRLRWNMTASIRVLPK
ncbi:MAG: efflux RND transporter periplasmic adaptor subunit [Roseiflexaceae bacterium]